MLKLNVINETSKLLAVLLGTAKSNGSIPTLEECYDPKSRENILNKTYPTENDMINEMNQFEQVLCKYEVNVIRPDIINNYNIDGTFGYKVHEFANGAHEASSGDVDNDGDLDVYLLNHTIHTPRNYGRSDRRIKRDEKSGDRLYENLLNEGTLEFIEVTDKAGIFSSSFLPTNTTGYFAIESISIMSIILLWLATSI